MSEVVETGPEDPKCSGDSVIFWIEPRAMDRLSPAARIIDVRTPGEYFGSETRLLNSELVPLSDLSRCSNDWDPDIEFLLVCDRGNRSAVGAQLLGRRGFHRVRVLRGGLRMLRKSPRRLLL